MTDGGHVPSEGLPEHLLGGPGPLGRPEGVSVPGTAVPGVAGPEAPLPGVVSPDAARYGVPGAVPVSQLPAQGTEGWPAEQRPAFTFLDQPDQLEDEDDLLLMPGPQTAWGEPLGPVETVMVAELPAVAQPQVADTMTLRTIEDPSAPAAQAAETVAAPGAAEGTPVEPSWPPVAPPLVAAEPVAVEVPAAELVAEAQPVPQAEPVVQAFAAEPVPPVAPVAAQPQVSAAQPPRRPLHAGPPIPDPSLMTGHVPVRSLADRGPSAQADPQAFAARPVQQQPQAPVPAAVPAQPVAVEQPAEQPVVEAPVAVEAPAAVEVPVEAPVEPVVEQVAVEPAPEPVPAVVEPVAAEPVAVEPVAAETAPVESVPVEALPVEAAAVPEAVELPVADAQAAPEAVAVVEPAAVPVEAAQQTETVQQAAEAAHAAIPAQAGAPTAPAAPGQSRRISAFLAAPAPLDFPTVAAEPGALAVAEPQTATVTGDMAVPEQPQQAAPVEPAAVEPEAVEAQAAVVATEPEAAPETAPEPEAVTVVETTTEAEPEAATAPAPAIEAEPAPETETATETETAAVTEAEAAPEAVADAPELTERAPAAPGYDEAGRDAVHQVIRERRDIRNGFRPDPIPHEVLIRVLEAAHTAPSVGYSQPWDFVVIRSAKTRRKMHELAERQRDAYADSLPKGRAKQFKEIKIEAILETPVNIVVTADRTRGGRHTLGRHTQPQMAPYSAALAVENLWLAARAEGLGVGWVSFFDEEEMVRELGLPEHLDVVAYLCVGFVDSFPDEPELQQQGWAKKRPLSWVVHEEQYGNRALPGEEPHDLLSDTLRGIRPLDAKALGEAWDRQKRMTKPAGSLGMLEIIAAQLSGLSRKCPPPIPEPACVAIFAGDHGVHAQGVTPWPQEVTAQMVSNFLAGGAVVNAFAAQVGAEVCVVDVGVKTELPDAIQQGRTTGLLPRKVKPGTDDMTQGPAMSREEALKAIGVGIETARDLVAAGNKVLITGDMGIANTTASAALISVFAGVDPAEVTGRGTGIDDETHARKVEVVRRALALHQPDPADPIGVLSAVGGLEHAAIAGFLLGAASLRTPVILDGVIAGSAALVAKAIAPEVLAACIAGHRSAEPGHQAALAKLGLRPLIDLDLRLGEGTGALLALPLVQSAARAMHDVATFDSAGVTEKA
ncbi:hypothetical protein GCM10009760_35480 [Kitasatospora kazusensis]|uniref:Nicotinate-nucleotide--dimethylbenzimidazole phosphoribosyltransferase n=1 Tax=Kitasatospora kazusensis TaxID=407974 RepID=A0ABP5LGQ0_9ACTN